jgi:hypothetical protein
VAGCSASPAGVAQSTSDDPCRFSTAEAIETAFGRRMKSSRVAGVCEYRGDGTGVVAVKVTAGPEGTILRFVKGAAAEGHEGAEKVATAVGEAYFDTTLHVFIGRVDNHDVQVETTIRPLPRDAMIAAGTRIMEAISRK